MAITKQFMILDQEIQYLKKNIKTQNHFQFIKFSGNKKIKKGQSCITTIYYQLELNYLSSQASYSEFACFLILYTLKDTEIKYLS